MKKGGKKIRLRLFDELSVDLSRNILGKSGVVWCPLCLNEFGREAAESGRLTEEHVIPESTGKKEVTLTCDPCNSALGSQIDGHLARKVRQDRAAKFGEKIKGYIKWHDGGAPVDMEISSAGTVSLHVKPTTPYVTEMLTDRLPQYVSGERQMRLTIEDRVEIPKYLASLVKAAYLGMFVDRGYGYILLPSLEPIRKAIREDGVEREHLPEIVFVGEINGVTELPAAPDRVTFEVHSLGGVPVCLSLINIHAASGAVIVVLPPGTQVNIGSWEGLGMARRALKDHPTFEVEMKYGGKMIISVN